MENSIEMNIKVNDYEVKLPYRVNNRSSAVALPEKYRDQEVCIIPLPYKNKLPKNKVKGSYNLKVKGSEIFRKETKMKLKQVIVYLPISLYKVDVLIFSAPKLKYDPLII